MSVTALSFGRMGNQIGCPYVWVFLLFKEAFLACLFQAGSDAFLIDVPNPFCRDSDGDGATLFRDVKGFRLEVGFEYPPGLLIGVRDFVSRHVRLARNFTNPCHRCNLKKNGSSKWSAKIERFIENYK